MKPIFISLLLMSFCSVSFSQMSKIESIKQQADAIGREIELLGKLFKFTNKGEKNIVVPSTASSELEILKKFNISTTSCYDEVRALPAYCVSPDDTAKLVNQISIRAQQAQVYINTYKKALNDVRTPTARLLLKKQLDEEKRVYEAAKQLKDRIEKEKIFIKNQIDSERLSETIGFLTGWVGVMLVVLALFALPGTSIISVFVLISGFLVAVNADLYVKKYHELFAKEDIKTYQSLDYERSKIERNFRIMESELRKNLDYFEMVNIAAVEEQQKTNPKKILP